MQDFAQLWLTRYFVRPFYRPYGPQILLLIRSLVSAIEEGHNEMSFTCQINCKSWIPLKRLIFIWIRIGAIELVCNVRFLYPAGSKTAAWRARLALGHSLRPLSNIPMPIGVNQARFVQLAPHFCQHCLTVLSARDSASLLKRPRWMVH